MKLKGAKIGNSTFKGANFSGTDLTGIVTAVPAMDGQDPAPRFSGAIFDAETKMPWSKERAIEVGMIEAATVKPAPGFPGKSIPTKENCEIEERR